MRKGNRRGAEWKDNAQGETGNLESVKKLREKRANGEKKGTRSENTGRDLGRSLFNRTKTRIYFNETSRIAINRRNPRSREEERQNTPVSGREKTSGDRGTGSERKALEVRETGNNSTMRHYWGGPTTSGGLTEKRGSLLKAGKKGRTTEPPKGTQTRGGFSARRRESATFTETSGSCERSREERKRTAAAGGSKEKKNANGRIQTGGRMSGNRISDLLGVGGVRYRDSKQKKEKGEEERIERR